MVRMAKFYVIYTLSHTHKQKTLPWSATWREDDDTAVDARAAGRGWYIPGQDGDG